MSPLNVNSCTGAGPGTPTVTIVDPNGDTNTARMVLNDMGKGTWKCEYIPTVVGNHRVEVLFDGIPIPKSPYDVRVSHGKSYIYIQIWALSIFIIHGIMLY